MDFNRLSNSITKEMNVSELDNKDLIGVHSMLHYWTENNSREDLCDFHKNVVEEMKKRNLKHIRKITFEEEEKPEIPETEGTIHMSEPHGKLIADGFKNLIVKANEYDVVGKHLYLSEEDKCYGIVKITTIEKMDLKQFNEFEYLHRITDLERGLWWKDKKELWGYQFNMVHKFNPPKDVKNLERELVGLPFGPYKDFDACVRKNKSKNNPKAYCASIMRKVEKQEIDTEPKELFRDPYVKSLLSDLTKALSLPEKQSILINSAIQEELGKKFKMPYDFNFIALKEGEFNGVWYSKDELKRSYHTLLGKDVTIDHGKSVRDVVGKISNVWWNDDLDQIEGTAKITEDEDVAKKIHNKLVTGVSVEVYVDKEPSKNGVIAKNPNFAALSIVVSPACRTCRIVNK